MRLAAMAVLVVTWALALRPPAALAQPAHTDTLVSIEDISLESLLDVTVSAASRHEQTARDAPSSVTVVSSDDIERHGLRTLRDVLATVRGLYLSDDQSYTSIGVRGFGRLGDFNNRVLLLVDGLPVNEGSSGIARISGLLGLSMEQVERVEVVRGPGSALYGTGAMFAVINVVTRRPEASPPLVVSAETGSHAHRSTTVSAARRLGAVGGVAATVFADADAVPDRAVADAAGLPEARQRLVGGNARATWGGLTLFGSAARRRMDVSRWGRIVADDPAHQQDVLGSFTAQYDRPLRADLRLRVQGSAFYGQIATARAYATADAGTQPTLYFDARSHWRTAEAQLRWDAHVSTRVIAGTEVRQAVSTVDLATRTTPNVDDEAGSWRWDVHTLAFYAQSEHTLTPRLTVTLGLRHDRPSMSGASTTPRVAAVFTPWRTSTFKLLCGRAYRAPGIYELRMQSAVEGVLAANLDLKPERLRTTEVVWEQVLPAASTASVSLFYNQLWNLVTMAYNPAIEALQNQNLGEATAAGVEVALSTQVDDVRAQASYSVTRARDLQADARLTNSPAHLAQLSVSAPLPLQLATAVRVRYESDRLSRTGASTAGFVLADLTVRRTLLDERLTLALDLRNAFDVQTALPVSHLYDVDTIPQAGRRLAARLTVRL